MKSWLHIAWAIVGVLYFVAYPCFGKSTASGISQKTLRALYVKYAGNVPEIKKDPRKWARKIALEAGVSKKTRRQFEAELFRWFSSGKIQGTSATAQTLRGAESSFLLSSGASLGGILVSQPALLTSVQLPITWSNSSWPGQFSLPMSNVFVMTAFPVGSVAAAPSINDQLPLSPETQAAYYPFPEYRPTWQTIQSDRAFIFLPSLPLWGGAISLGGYYGRDLFLAAASVRGSNINWQINSPNTNIAPLAWHGHVLPLALIAEGVYEVFLSDDTRAGIESFWLAIPRNLAPVDDFQPSGHVHAEFPGEQQTSELHIWGRVSDPVQSGVRKNGHGMGKALIRVEGQWIELALSSDGRFDITLSVTSNSERVHTVELWANDLAHVTPVRIDAEHVSEYRALFVDIRDRYVNSSVGCCMYSYGMGTWMGGWSLLISPTSSPQVIARGKPMLDENGLLLLDASSSSNATQYAWELTNLATQDRTGLEGVSVSCEGLAASLYGVQLKATALGYENPQSLVYASPGNLGRQPPDGASTTWGYCPPVGVVPLPRPVLYQSFDHFSLLIPPRINLNDRGITGAIHTRWVAEFRSNTQVWVCYLSGHVFDEISATMDALVATDLTAWAMVNGQRVDLSLDDNGHFFQRYEIGPLVDENYTISLHASSPHQPDYEVDVLTQSYLNYFLRR